LDTPEKHSSLYNPEYYDLLHSGNPGDLDFYLKQCKGSTGVLEIGCGSGRIALTLARHDIPVTGLDNHPGMIEKLLQECGRLSRERQRLVTTVLADMRDFKLGKKFDRIIIPFNGLLCLLGEQEVIDCLKCASGHLLPDGELIFDIYNVPEYMVIPGAQTDEVVGDEPDDESPIAILVSDENTIHVFERLIPNDDPLRFDSAYRYKVSTKNNEIVEDIEYSIPQRCILTRELAPLCERAGLVVKSIIGDFMSLNIDDDTDQLIVVACLQ
jgi:SAM-dependent methyltransferase